MNALTAAATVDRHLSVTDCWNHIGVRGDRSCERLAEYVHCRNCPVYSTGARALLDGPRPARQSVEWTRQVALPRTPAQPTAQSIVIFRLGANWLALPTATLVEVASERPVHSLPNRRDRVVLGIANVRGQLLTCVSLERVLGLAAVGRERAGERHSPASGVTRVPGHGGARTQRRRLLVFQRARLRLVSHVDEVHGVHDVAPGDLTAVPDTIATPMAAYSRTLVSWHGRSVGLLDADLLFDAVRKSLG
jgi:chemotaxis-related protein WspD